MESAHPPGGSGGETAAHFAASSLGSARPFVGRAGELARITHTLEEVLAGSGRFVLLMGEPGIGKTRLCDEVTALATDRGVPVLWGRSWEAGGAPAYWPWLDVLQGLARRLEATALATALGDSAALILDLVPEIRERLPPLPSLTAVAPPPPDEARFRLWRTVFALVKQVAEPNGLVLIFDDLHSADRPSLLLLYALARQLRSARVLVVATCRDVEARLDPETGEIIARLGREGMHLGLSRLDRTASTDLLRGRHGALAPELESRLYESTQGNPLFLEEMLRLLEEDGPASIAAGVIPAGVRDVIRARLDRVPADARGLLNVAAVAGDEIQPALVARALDRDAAWVAGKIADAIRAGVLVERAGRARFSHALVREVLYRDLTPAERRTLHGAVGRALESGSGSSTAPPLMELAHHAIEGPEDDPARTVDFATRAARRALDTAAPEEAIAVLERAVQVVDAAASPLPLRAPLLLALGEARIRAGDVEAGKALCCETAALARTLGDAALMADTALTYGRVLTFAVVDPVMVQLFEDALGAQPAGDSPTRARLLARLAGALQPAVRAEEPVRIAREAIAMARRLGDRRGLLQTIHDALSAMMDVVDPRERLALNREVETLAVATGDRERLLRTHARLALDHLSLGQFPEADARIDAFQVLATELGASWILWRAPLFRAVRAATHGRFQEAEGLEQEARALSLKTQDPQAERALVFHREGLLRIAERHLEMRQLDARARRERASFHNGTSWQDVGSAFMYTRLELEEQARVHLDAIPEEVRPPIDNLFALFFMAEAAAFVGSPALARKVYDLLLPAADQYVMLGMTHVQWEGPVVRLMGLLAARLGQWALAIAHFEDAIDRLRRLDAGPHLARARYEFGRALLQRVEAEPNHSGAGDDRRRAAELLLAAREGADELGLPALAALAERRLQSIVGPTGPTGPTGPLAAPAGEQSMPASATSPPGLTLRLEGEYWTLSRGPADRAPLRLKDSLGLQYLARLMAEPGREVHVLDLVAAGPGPAAAGGGEGPIDLGDAGEHLDDEARADYRRRLDDLRETLAEAESFGDPLRATRARAEIEFLAAELGRAVGLGGRARRSGSAAERARSAVQRRIKNALGRIDELAPELGATLARRIKTGNFCVYRPDPP